ncbi:MAG: hypothetical protein QOG21_1681, partial [Actinomycetota bacterium]|nr:hypothetical protein [Actinomycetota bacterium]
KIEATGMSVFATDTIMRNDRDSKELAGSLLQL